MSTEVYRVAVSGVFKGLSEATQEFLRRNAADHDPMDARFEAEPNLTYRRGLDVFTVRLEVRVDTSEGSAGAEAPETMAELLAIEEATMFLQVLGLGHGDLGTRASSMSAATDRG
ncbi:MAG: DUF6204 family protein [Acidimicrobiales bacterium]